MTLSQNLPKERVFLGITGASGSLYAERLLLALLKNGIRTYVCFSNIAKSVVKTEMPQGLLPLLTTTQLKKGLYRDKTIRETSLELGVGEKQLEELRVFDNGDLYSPVASGSAGATHFVICPTSMGTLGRMAHGMSSCLIERAADVALKEKRPLVVVPRETPLSLIHLENMAGLMRAGAHIVPAMPAFYHNPKSILDLVDFLVERIMSALKLEEKSIKKIQWNKTSL